jgi:hypothetical protein
MITATELKVADLRKELATLEAEAAAKTTISSQLVAAQAAENEATRAVRVNAKKIEDENLELTNLRRSRDAAPQYSVPRDKIESQIRFKQEEIRSLTVETSNLEKTLGEKRSAREEAERQIATHPVFVAIRKQQADLVSEAATVVESFFDTPLKGWLRLAEIVAKLEQRENDLISRSIRELSAAGLPDIPRILTSFFQQAVPLIILNAIDHEQRRAFQEVRRVREMASRGTDR